LVRIKETDRRLACSVNRLNEYFSGGQGQQMQEEDREIEADSIFDDRKFFFEYATPSTISTAFVKMKSNAMRADEISLKLIKTILSTTDSRIYF